MDLAEIKKKTAGENRRAIFVNRFYWPDESATSQLLTDVAEHLSANGTDVSIVTSRLGYTNQEIDVPSMQCHNGVQIHRVWTTAFHRRSIVGRMIDFLTFYLSSSLTLLRLVQPGDLVIAKTDPPLIQIFVWFATWIKRAQLINWCQDLFPELLSALKTRLADRALTRLLSGVRNFALNRSAMNVTISNDMKKTLVRQGINTGRVCVIRNWCDRLIESVPMEANSLKRDWGLQDQFVIEYSGNLGRAHVADKVHDLIGELVDVEATKFVFIGSGSGMTWLRNQCHRSGHRHVTFKSYQPRRKLSQSLSLADLHLISLGRRFNEFLAPSKFYGVLAAGRPIVFLGDPKCELAREIDELRLGIILDIDDQASWRDLVVQLKNNHSERAAMAMNARAAYENRFQARHSLKAWEQIIQAGTGNLGRISEGSKLQERENLAPTPT